MTDERIIAIIDLLRERFPNRHISITSDWNWLPICESHVRKWKLFVGSDAAFGGNIIVLEKFDTLDELSAYVRDLIEHKAIG